MLYVSSWTRLALETMWDERGAGRRCSAAGYAQAGWVGSSRTLVRRAKRLASRDVECGDDSRDCGLCVSWMSAAVRALSFAWIEIVCLKSVVGASATTTATGCEQIVVRGDDDERGYDGG